MPLKFLKILHITLGIIPFAWLVTMLSILVVGTFHFGYIPQYGKNLIDPYGLGLDWLSLSNTILFILSFLSVAPWLILTLLLSISPKYKIALSKFSIITFSIGIIGFLLFKFVFTDVFLWIMD